MKTTKLILMLLVASAAVFAGCGKSNKAPDSITVNGVVLDTPKLQAAFVSAAPELQALVTDVGFGIRYGDYVKSLMALDKLVNNPSLTPEQKKLVTTVIEQVKQLAAKAPAQPAN